MLNLKISDKGLKFIADHEGFSPCLYDDVAGHCTVGYGHLVHKGPCDGRSTEFDFKAGLTPARALELLRKDASLAEATVNRLVKVPLTQERFDALVSFTFNVGPGAFEGSTVLREVNAGHWNMVPPALEMWRKAGGKVVEGLARRRKLEGAAFA